MHKMESFVSSWRMFGSFATKLRNFRLFFRHQYTDERFTDVCILIFIETRLEENDSNGKMAVERFGALLHTIRQITTTSESCLQPHRATSAIPETHRVPTPPLPSHSATFQGLSRTYSIKFNNNIKIIIL